MPRVKFRLEWGGSRGSCSVDRSVFSVIGKNDLALFPSKLLLQSFWNPDVILACPSGNMVGGELFVLAFYATKLATDIALLLFMRTPRTFWESFLL